MRARRDGHIRARKKNVKKTAIETSTACFVAKSFLQAIIQLFIDFPRDRLRNISVRTTERLLELFCELGVPVLFFIQSRLQMPKLTHALIRSRLAVNA